LKAQSNALKAYIGLGQNLLVLTDKDAGQIQGVVNIFRPTGQWKQAQMPRFEDRGSFKRVHSEDTDFLFRRRPTFEGM